MICFSGSHQRLSRPVIDTGSDDGKSQCPVHRTSKINGLQRSQTLVVIHRHHHIYFLFLCEQKSCFCRTAPNTFIPLSVVHHSTGESSRFPLFPIPFSPACGFKPHTANRGFSIPRSYRRWWAAVRIVRRMFSRFNASDRHKRNMRGDQCNFQCSSRKRHHRRRTTNRSQKIGVPRELKPFFLKPFLLMGPVVIARIT